MPAATFSTGSSSRGNGNGMSSISRQRDIIDRRALAGRLSLAALSANAPALDRKGFVTPSIYPLPNPTSGERLAIVGVGGYGRGELAPYSDVDLLFLLPYKRTPHTEQVVEYLLYLLWDLGLKIGQSTRSVEECLRQAQTDMTVRTGLLEARYLWGDEALFRELRKRFDGELLRGGTEQFVEAKLAER